MPCHYPDDCSSSQHNKGKECRWPRPASVVMVVIIFSSFVCSHDFFADFFWGEQYIYSKKQTKKQYRCPCVNPGLDECIYNARPREVKFRDIICEILLLINIFNPCYSVICVFSFDMFFFVSRVESAPLCMLQIMFSVRMLMYHLLHFQYLQLCAIYFAS